MKPLQIISANVDFALKPETIGKDLKRLIDEGEVIAFQEAKWVDIDRLIKDPEWEVVQYKDSEAAQGSGIAFRTARIRQGRSGKRLGVEPRGQKMLARWMVWTVLWVRDETNEEHPIVVASVHMPPKRYAILYPLYVGSLITFAAFRKKPIIFVGDWNKHFGDKVLTKLAGRVKGKFHLHGIDGVLLIGKGKWKVRKVVELDKTHSDHRPVKIVLESTS